MALHWHQVGRWSRRSDCGGSGKTRPQEKMELWLHIDRRRGSLRQFDLSIVYPNYLSMLMKIIMVDSGLSMLSRFGIWYLSTQPWSESQRF
jgi:hypothetical protein